MSEERAGTKESAVAPPSAACVTCGCPEEDHPGFLAIGPCDKYQSAATSTDWTRDEQTGRSNSSPEFVRLADEVGRLIRDSAHSLIRGGSDGVGRLIVAQLAHNHGMSPGSANEDVKGNVYLWRIGEIDAEKAMEGVRDALGL